ncbi:PKD domain-containing protein [Alloalcanivorax marinus]|uniref:PKD domain-containing protein n=1 Tax=Alloalcanivorax marinus TaxID=1177169 RepID=UPI0019321581|nr:PKD domain-containing protein [Alloalcanivorax marinus]MBL7251874.1 PKD domain-containing protein [Alloalcanivorax marinus]
MALLIRPISLFCLLLVLAACGGGGGGGGGGDAVDRPQARASADTTEVNAAEGTVHLDGGESTSPNGDITTWQWRFLSRPDGSEATLDGADTAQASFIPDLPGTYVIQLVVNDGTADSGDGSSSRVTVTALNPNPLAVVPNEINWILGTVQLDGSRSLPPDGGDASQLVYDWTLTQKPDGSAAELDDGSQIYPRFTADEVGEYQAELVVRYGDKASQPATVNIHIVEEKAPPVAAIAPLDETVLRGEIATVDGSPSEDPNGGELQYRWRFTSLPAGASGEFLNGSEKQAQARFVVDSAARAYYRLELCVYNGISRTCTRPFQVNVAAPEDEPNTPPVAVIAPSYNATWEAERGASVNTSGGSSYDIDGDALTYKWELVSAPSGFDAGSNSSLDSCVSSTCWPGFTPTVDGSYQVRLTVSDGEASDSATETFTARLGANRPPSASAAISGASTVLVGVRVTFDGEGSTDPDDNRLDYQWTLLDRPDASQTVLQGRNTAFPTLVPDQAGPYRVRLVVTDEHGWSSLATEVVLMAKAANNIPLTRISKAASHMAGEARTFTQPDYSEEQPFAIVGQRSNSGGDGPFFRNDYFALVADSYDPDGDPLSHLWSLVDGPSVNRWEYNSYGGLGCLETWNRLGGENLQDYLGRVAARTEWPCPELRLGPTEPGTYVFQYQVYDGSEFAGPFTATVHAVLRENYPGLLLEIPTTYYRDGNPIDGALQATFPWVDEQVWRSSDLQQWNEGLINRETFRLTAFGGDYTLVDVATNSDNPNYVPEFYDLTSGRAITEGYVIPQGESIDIVYRLAISGESEPTSQDGREAVAARLREANIHGSFRIQERAGWMISIGG